MNYRSASQYYAQMTENQDDQESEELEDIEDASEDVLELNDIFA